MAYCGITVYLFQVSVIDCNLQFDNSSYYSSIIIKSIILQW